MQKTEPTPVRIESACLCERNTVHWEKTNCDTFIPFPQLFVSTIYTCIGKKDVPLGFPRVVVSNVVSAAAVVDAAVVDFGVVAEVGSWRQRLKSSSKFWKWSFGWPCMDELVKLDS